MATCTLRRRGGGAKVVFLGGCPTPWDVLSRIAEGVTDAHEAIEVALPGYGPSPPLPSGSRLDDAHAVVEDSLVAAGVRECALVGFSAGAYRALAIATRGRVRATHVLTLGGLASFSAEESASFRGFAAAVRAGQDLHPLAVPRFLSPAFAASHPEECRTVTAWLDAVTPRILAEELDAFAGAPDLTPALARLAVPVVARVGALDQAVPPPKSEEIARACPRGRLEVVDASGHALPFEDAAGTIASLRTLLASG